MASAQPGVAPTPLWTDLLQPPVEIQQKACDDLAAFEKANPSPAGQKYTSAALPAEQTIGQQLIDNRRTPGTFDTERVDDEILIHLPAASVATTCANAARLGQTVNLKKYNFGPARSELSTIFYILSDAALVSDAMKYKAFLRLLDASGQLLAVRQPAPYSRAADPAQWQQHCDGNACRWYGFSVFRFNDLRLTPAIYAKLHTLQLVYDRGYGTETRTYVAADFTRTTLKD